MVCRELPRRRCNRGRRRWLLVGASTAWLLLSAGTVEAQVSAYEILARVEKAYGDLVSYHDRGVVERRRGDLTTERLRFETAFEPSRFRYLLGPQERRSAASGMEAGALHVLWRGGEGSFHFRGDLGQFRPVAALFPEMVQSFGEGGLEGLVVPALLLGLDSDFAHPEAASAEGPEPCNDAMCHQVALTRHGASVESRLWIDSESFLIHRLELDLVDAGEMLRQAASAAGLPDPGHGRPPPPPGSKALHLTVRFDEVEVGSPPPQPTTPLTPPTGALRVSDWQPPEPATPSLPPSDRTFEDRIDVSLVTVMVRVVDSRGNPILELEPQDFEVRLGKELVKVEAVDWVSSQTPLGSDLPPQVLAETGLVVDPPGKLVVFFVQADMHPVRVAGHLRMLPQTGKILDSLERDDEAAVVSFDSHLKLRQDFTRERALLEDALQKAIRTGRPPAVEPGFYPSLARHLDPAEARQAASPERALELVAQALLPLHGEKALVFLGWGLGRYGAFGLHMTPDYSKAKRALERARVTVFVLDVTNADYHTLEMGLKTVVEDTGGTYAKTNVFPAQVTDRLARTLTGHYVLTLARPTRASGRRRLRIKVPGRRATVLTQLKSL